MSKLRTTIEISTGGLDDYEIPVMVEYSYYRGYDGKDSPPEPESVSIKRIRVVTAGNVLVDADWLHDLLCDDDELLNLCMVDYVEDQQAEAEYRAEQMREDRMLAERERGQ